MKFVYEYGHRWNLKLPRNDIRFLVRRMHCSTPEAEVQETIRLRCIDSNIPINMHKACMRYASCVHNDQAFLFHSVCRGIAEDFDAVIAKVRVTGYASLTREECKVFDAPSMVRFEEKKAP